MFSIKTDYQEVTSDMIAGFSGEYRFLSNFYPSQISTIDGFIFGSAESYYQSLKTLDPEKRKAFQHMKPGEAKRQGRRVKLRDDWEKVKFILMLEVVTDKFKQNPELAKLLIATKPKWLIEKNHWNDRIWGVDLEMNGENQLGKILQEVRERVSS